ncbi:phosphoenolpyruvate--protein phosphotransferase [Veillonella caviae]|uniref:phosphoenolpyruvate--protein phosphotransferase n=1 Tax=Veillonella caviae TaxID=248316 RepID=UPI0023F9F481|nr:phosphoenolpyruvate--protein phosphotransferase [Veillonella caviae]MCI7693342.1 phosphoenolpyruvate--protein phosphotransferase [Veillonella caviae]MDD7290324.1 phosphoenolpyruvate--protein phosphotransferase [Veillonella caviae]MDY4746710.1 phosphoenolpyruvate--protein phosphotransferase [Veillonella caviae]MDY5253305.1 phosphoenolpyruvate--protein phosphotransferase [Veillonella caviae]MDY5787739.1 phosphoenolpyruvate--protein phosphotransferase [Veillonella caviae]
MRIQGISGSRGVAVGNVYKYIQEEIIIPDYTVADGDVEAEIGKFAAAMAATLKQLDIIRQKALVDMGPEEAAIFEAHMQIAQDPSLSDGIKSLVESTKTNVVAATAQTIDTFAGIFLGMDDPYMRERGADIKDIGDRLMRNMLGMNPRGLSHISGQVILVAHDLAPSDTASLDKNVVKGIVTAAGGPTSHAAIMARTLEIPAVMGVGDIESFVDGARAVVLGTDGVALMNPSDAEWADYSAQAEAFQDELKRLKDSANLEAVTVDGHHVDLFGNIGKSKDADNAINMGASGIGLYRTEFLYMENDELPAEDVQFEEYKQVAESLHGNPVIIRTMDIGGDKELKCLDLPEEMNPFLGYRAIRISLNRPDIFKVQLRALLRASAFGDIHIMYPMIASVEEVKCANVMLEECKAELRKEGVAFNEDIKVGIMIEVPAAAVIAPILAKYVDFFSIGTNDLCQYTLAVDRMNEAIGNLYQPLHPGVLRLIKGVIDASHEQGKFTGMCGELAGDPVATMILLGLGLDEFSMTASSIPLIKNILRSVSKAECEAVATHALTLDTAEEITAYAKSVLAEKGLA